MVMFSLLKVHFVYPFAHLQSQPLPTFKPSHAFPLWVIQLQATIFMTWFAGALTAGLNWYRANFHPELFGQTKPRMMPQLNCPVLGIWSTRDTALTREQMMASKQYTQQGMWQYAELEAGHWIPRDAPEQLNTLLLGFLESQGRRHDEGGAALEINARTARSKL
jgi:pimeloyl-ACP methyl ester carboxylesterase